MQLPSQNFIPGVESLEQLVQSEPQGSPIAEASVSSPFLSLPPEVHHHISTYLQYPDLLALTLVHPLFQSHELIHTSKSSRVDWLIDRSFHKLPLPSRTRCRWSSDREFVNNPEIKDILQRRRRHEECAEFSKVVNHGPQCFVLEGRVCDGIRKSKKKARLSAWYSLGTIPQSNNWHWRGSMDYLGQYAWQTFLAATVAVLALVWAVL